MTSSGGIGVGRPVGILPQVVKYLQETPLDFLTSIDCRYNGSSRDGHSGPNVYKHLKGVRRPDYKKSIPNTRIPRY